MRSLLPFLLLPGCVTAATVGDRIPEPIPDLDEDGWSADEDCDDLDATVHPTAPESCDGVDNNCDEAIDDGEVCLRSDDFTQTMQLDVLLVVDNSASMLEEQVAVANGIEDLLGWVVGDFYDTHIGAISMDMDHQKDAGSLQFDSNHHRNFTTQDDSLEAVEAFIRDVVVMGTGGSFDERGRDAVKAAVVDLNDTMNAGFRRRDAHLAVLFISDEDDVSELPVTDFLSELSTVSDDTSFHALVSPDYDCGESPGDSYLDLVDVSGGTTLSICEPDYGPFLAAVGQISAQRGLEREFQLSGPAQPGSVRVEIVYPTGLALPLDSSDFALGGLGDVLVLTGVAPPPSSRIRVQWDAAI